MFLCCEILWSCKDRKISNIKNEKWKIKSEEKK